MRQLIRNIAIFDGTGSAPYPGAVMIGGDRIADILRDEAAIDAAQADMVIDGQGATLMPGMVDAHTHLTWGSSVEKIYHQFILPPEELKVAAWRNARVLLDHGYTSLYSAGALGDQIEPELARAIAAGETPGPRLVPSTLERSPEGEEGVETGDVFNGRGPEAMRAFVAYCAAEGVKSLKLVISGEDALKPGSSQDILYTDAEMIAAGEAAKEAGLWIATHAYSPRAITLALEAGARILYHCSFADDAAVDAMAAKKDEPEEELPPEWVKMEDGQWQRTADGFRVLRKASATPYELLLSGAIALAHGPWLKDRYLHATPSGGKSLPGQTFVTTCATIHLQARLRRMW